MICRMESEEPKTVHRGIKKGLYVIPTAFTAANVAMGFLAVLYSIRAFQVVQTDPERGLILVEGAVPGAKGGWIMLRDAVKKALPKDAPKPGKFRATEGAAAPEAGATPAAEQAQEGA